MSPSAPIKLEQDLIEEIARIESKGASTFFSLADYYVYRRENNLLAPAEPASPEPPAPEPCTAPPPDTGDSSPAKGLEEAVTSLSLEDITLTPVGPDPPAPGPLPTEKPDPPSPSAASGQAPPVGQSALTDALKQVYQELDESFMYLGVLQKLPLPDAMRLFADKFEAVVSLLGRTFASGDLPAAEELFEALGEDYEKLKMLVHAEDAVNPIFDGINRIHEALEPLREQGASWSEAECLLTGAFSSWQ